MEAGCCVVFSCPKCGKVGILVTGILLLGSLVGNPFGGLELLLTGFRVLGSGPHGFRGSGFWMAVSATFILVAGTKVTVCMV